MNISWKKDEIPNADDVARFYDRLYYRTCFQKKSFEDFLAVIENVKSTSRILSVGCGTGVILTSLFADGFKNLYGVDISLSMIKESRSKGLPNLIRCDGENMPYRSNVFDAVVCSATLHHFPMLNRIVGEIHRVLRPAGYLFIQEPNFNYHRFKSLRGKLFNFTFTLMRAFFRKLRALRQENFSHLEPPETRHHRKPSTNEMVSTLSREFDILLVREPYLISPILDTLKFPKICCRLFFFLDFTIKNHNGGYLIRQVCQKHRALARGPRDVNKS